jgi:hypothetical protein
MPEKVLPIRGFLIHLSHYDPVWYARKSREQPFDLGVASDIVDAMAEADMNMLVIDVADGVKFKSHPELKRRYSVPMGTLRKLVERARKAGLEVVPKLNFAQSSSQYHNEWFRPHNVGFDTDHYWKLSFELVDELIAECGPERFFHVGMDEDTDRSHRQYAAAVRTLADGVESRGLRAVMWKDRHVICPGIWEEPGEKSLAAEKAMPKGVVQVPWGYREAYPDLVRRMRRKGFEVWGATGNRPALVREWRDGLLKHGATGILLTAWRPCRPGNRRSFLEQIRTCGPLCKGG